MELRDGRGPLLSLCPRFTAMLGRASTLLGGVTPVFTKDQGDRMVVV